MSPSFHTIKNILTLKGELLSLIKGKSFTWISSTQWNIQYSTAVYLMIKVSQNCWNCYELSLTIWLLYWEPLLYAALKQYSWHDNKWEKSRCPWTLFDIPQIKYAEAVVKMKCFVLFCVYLCIYRVCKQAHSQVDIQPIESFSIMSQKMRQDMGQNMIMSRSYQTSIFSRLNEIATITFNTGVSIFTKNLSLVCLAWV